MGVDYTILSTFACLRFILNKIFYYLRANKTKYLSKAKINICIYPTSIINNAYKDLKLTSNCQKEWKQNFYRKGGWKLGL